MAATTNHEETTVMDLAALLDAGEGAVVTLVAGEARLAAHRAVLAAGSPVMAAMFSHDMQEASSGEVAIPDVEGPVLRQLLAYFYTGRVPQLPGMAPQLLAAADKYGVVALKDACEQQVVGQLGLENAAAAAVLAVRHSCLSLRQSAISFIKDHIFEVMMTQGWTEAVCSQPEAFVEVNQLLGEQAAETRAAAAAAAPAAAPAAASCPQTPPPDDAAISRFLRLSGEEKNSRLREAAGEGAEQEVRALLAAGADVGAGDEGGWTALHDAADNGRVQVAHRLLQAGARVDARTTGQCTPLHMAARGGQAAVVRLLVASSADVGARDVDGQTPLHRAALWGQGEAAAALLEAGADRAARNVDGRTPLDVAMENNHRHLIHILR